MATYSVIKLSGITQIHMGTGRESYDFSATDLCSDTLMSALASMMAIQGESSEIETFLSSVRLSSAFPYYHNDFFMPVPKGRLNVEVEGDVQGLHRKSLKQVKFMSLSLWEKLLSGETVSISKSQICGDYITNRTSLLTSQIYKSHVTERVFVPRDDAQDSEPFFFEWKYFEKESGLFVLTDAIGEQFKKLLSLMEALGEQGLGTDKSVGGGKFLVKSAGTIAIAPPANSDSIMLLSLYLPTPDELAQIDLESSRYSLLLRGGFMAGSQEETFRHLRKRSVYMIDAGSVLHTNIPLKGKVVDLRPEWNDPKMHPAFRSGRPLSIPIKR